MPYVFLSRINERLIFINNYYETVSDFDVSSFIILQNKSTLIEWKNQTIFDNNIYPIIIDDKSQ